MAVETADEDADGAPVNKGRRYLLIGAAAGMSGIGAVLTAVPFVKAWNPSARARAAGAPIRVDISRLQPGEMLGPIPSWRGQPVFIVARDPSAIEHLEQANPDLADPASENLERQPQYARNPWRSREADIGVYLASAPGPLASYGASSRASTRLAALSACRLPSTRRVVRVRRRQPHVPPTPESRHRALDEETPEANRAPWPSRRLGLATSAALTDTGPTHKIRAEEFHFWYTRILATSAVLQLLTGLWLTMSYVPSGEGAFASVEYIMRDVEYGWLIRYLHSTGASAFFLVVYLHMFRALAYGSYRKPRELLWLIGMAIYLALMAEGFFGYLLPWGNMCSGRPGHRSLIGAHSLVGADLMEWVRGDFLMSDITLNRFFALHVFALPLALVALVFLHIVALHHVGSNNPDGIDIKANKDAEGKPVDGIPFHPYYTVHDFQATVVFLILFCAVVFFAPEMFGYFIEKPNFEEANPLKTPELITPVWYYTPFYSMLRAVTFPFLGLSAKFWGLVVMAAAIVCRRCCVADRSPVSVDAL